MNMSNECSNRHQALVIEKLEHFVSRHGAAEEVALDFITAVIAQHFELFLDLHPLGDDFAPQGLAHGDDGPDDLRVVMAGGDV